MVSLIMILQEMVVLIGQGKFSLTFCFTHINHQEDPSIGAQPFPLHSSQAKKNYNNLIILLLITRKFAYVYDQMRVKT